MKCEADDLQSSVGRVGTRSRQSVRQVLRSCLPISHPVTMMKSSGELKAMRKPDVGSSHTQPYWLLFVHAQLKAAFLV